MKKGNVSKTPLSNEVTLSTDSFVERVILNL